MKKSLMFALLISASFACALQRELERLTFALVDLKDDLSKPPVPPRDDQHLQGNNDNNPPPLPLDEDNGFVLPPIIPHSGQSVQRPPVHILPDLNQQDGPLPAIPDQTQDDEDERLNLPQPPIPHDETSIVDDKDGKKNKPVVHEEPALPLNSQPPMEFKQSVEREIYSPLNKTLKTVENQTLKAIVGITADGDMIVWGPKLKVAPNHATFIQKNHAFTYPNSDALNLKIENGKVRTEFVPYTLVNMKELHQQREEFDQLLTKYGQVAGKRADILDSAKYGSYVDTLQNLIAEVHTAFKNGALKGSIFPISLGARTISKADVQKLSDGIHGLYKELVIMVQSALAKADKTKDAVYAEWKSQGTPTNLLEGRWEKASQYTQVRNDLITLPAIQAKLQSVDLTPVAAPGSQADQLVLIGAYYNQLRRTGSEDVVDALSSDSDTESDDENAAPNQKRTEKEEEEIDALKIEIVANFNRWQSKLPPLEAASVKSKLNRYLILQRKDDADWKPLGKLFALYSYYGIAF